MPAGKPIAEETENEIVKMAKAGYSARRIAERFGLNDKTVYNVAKRNDVHFTRGRKGNYIYGE